LLGSEKSGVSLSEELFYPNLLLLVNPLVLFIYSSKSSLFKTEVSLTGMLSKRFLLSSLLWYDEGFSYESYGGFPFCPTGGGTVDFYAVVDLLFALSSF
jgi:hypothetical protein